MVEENKTTDEKADNSAPDDFAEIDKQPCPMCSKNELTLREFSRDIPFFGKVFVFSMSCSNCGYHKSDVEPAEQRDSAKYSMDVSGEEDMNVRIVKSASATVKIPRITTITSGPASNGYVTNVEGLLNRVKTIIEHLRDESEDKSERKKAKNMLKKIQNVMWGRESIKITIEDPTGNSAIISEKAVKQKL
ncbi:MAG: ZPR1 zinc finger domain-containing protein [Candidatus Woesearchaeota archaeon]